MRTLDQVTLSRERLKRCAELRATCRPGISQRGEHLIRFVVATAYKDLRDKGLEREAQAILKGMS